MATLKLGSKGKDVVALQKALVAMGIKPTVRTNGAFDAKTETAVKAYQKKNGLKVDGIVGNKTNAKLQNSAKGRRKKIAYDAPDYAKLMKVAKKRWESSSRSGSKAIIFISNSTDPAVKKLAKEYGHYYSNLHTDYRNWVKEAKVMLKLQKEHSAAVRNDPWSAEELAKKVDDTHPSSWWQMELLDGAIGGMERLNKMLVKSGYKQAA